MISINIGEAGVAAQRFGVGAIGIFDSGYGGLTVFKDIVEALPQYDYIYLGDNARTPYGPRSFATVYDYTWQCVQWLFQQGCPLVVLACNTASAKALRSIQQINLPQSEDPTRRVLGVIRPTSEVLGTYSSTGHVGILGTSGTVKSQSYPIELAKFWPNVQVYQQACPMWVPLIENGVWQSLGAQYFIAQDVAALMVQQPKIDTVLLACTHYPILAQAVAECLPAGVTLLSQGKIVAKSLGSYLERHQQMEARLAQRGGRQFFTTDSADDFEQKASVFLGSTVAALQVAV